MKSYIFPSNSNKVQGLIDQINIVGNELESRDRSDPEWEKLQSTLS